MSDLIAEFGSRDGGGRVGMSESGGSPPRPPDPHQRIRPPDCHVAWLASLAADLFEQWSNEVDGIIGHATGRVVPYLITRSLAVDMAARSAELEVLGS